MMQALRPLVALLSFGVAAYAIAAYALLPIGAVLHPDIRPTFVAHGPLPVYLHVFGAAVALLLGPVQFWTSLRARRPQLHRWLGTAYLALGVGIGGLSGLVLALGAFGGVWSRSGFASLASAWLATGAMALWCILRGDVAGHRRWMTRNFALTLAAVMLRLYLPASMLAGLDLVVAYPLVAWLCWLPNLALAEAWLRRNADIEGSGTAMLRPGPPSPPTRPGAVRGRNSPPGPAWRRSFPRPGARTGRSV